MEAAVNDYPTCYSTYATLRCFHPTELPESVSEVLAVEPSKVLRVGQPWG